LTDEKQLIQALQNGSEQAFRSLVEMFQSKVTNTTLGFVPDLQDAEDIAQEVFVEVCRSGNKFREESKLSTWIYRITTTKSLEFIRHKKRKKRMAFFQSLIGLEDDRTRSSSDEFNHPGVQLENKERVKILFDHIDKLPENQKVAFTLQKVEGLSQKEISSIMETTESAIESLLHRAKKNLQKSIHNFYKKKMI